VEFLYRPLCQYEWSLLKKLAGQLQHNQAGHKQSLEATSTSPSLVSRVAENQPNSTSYQCIGHQAKVQSS